MEVKGIFATLRTTVRGLSTEMKRMNAISENIANSDRTPDKDGRVYKRKIVVENPPVGGKTNFSSRLKSSMRRSRGMHLTESRYQDHSKEKGSYEENFQVVELEGEKLIYDPRHPKADKNGYIRMPNVNMVEEMVDLITASRAYEANVTMMTAIKNMAKKAMEI